MDSFRVLIVEDEIINAKILQEFLINKGYEVLDVVTTGEDAVDYVSRIKPDIILMDIELAGNMNGIEAAEQINRGEHFPILYLTSQTNKEVVNRARETGPVGYIIKPFSPHQLEITMEMARKKIIVDQELINYQLYLEHLVVDRTRELIDEVELNNKISHQAISSEVKLTAITSAANDAIILFDEYGQIKFWNQAASKMFRYSENDIIDQNIRILFSSDNQNFQFAKALESIQEAIDKSLFKSNLELAATKADGEEFPVEMSMASVVIDHEKFIISVVRDITQRKKDVDEITRFKLISDMANYGMAITDGAGTFVYMNKYFARLIEVTPDEMLGKSFFLLTPHEKKSTIADFVQKSSEVKGGEGQELLLTTKMLNQVPVMVNSVIIRDKYQQPQFFAISAVDIRERKEYEENLLRAKRLAEESDRMKTAFLSTISHELRTPLNAIIGFSELIRMTEVDMTDVKDFNEEIYKSGNHLLSIVEDILDISLLENKNLKINTVEFSLNNLMNNIYQKFKSNLRYNNQSINLVWKGNKPDGDDKFYTDNSKLEQIFSKLLDNAYKFSTKGTIEFGYKYYEKENIFDFYVKDEGKGIHESKLTDIFESFKQIDEGNNRAHDGLGLGLSIVNQLLELMNGEIFVESKPKKGSVFTFNIKPKLKS